MAFTYAGTLTTDLDYIRFKINDTVENSGVKPNGGNFSDAEINGLLVIEGTKERTVAAIYETLSIVWANFVDTKIGPRDEKLSQVSARYAQWAKEWRDDYGLPDGISSVTTGSINLGIDEEDSQLDIT